MLWNNSINDAANPGNNGFYHVPWPSTWSTDTSNYVSSGGTPFPWSEAVDDPCDLNTLFFTHAAWGDYAFTGAPAREDVFGLQQHPLDDLLPLEFERNGAGEIIALTYEETRFERR